MTKDVRIWMAAGFLAAAASSVNAEIPLTEELSVYGYLDVYAQKLDVDGDSFEADVNEFELGFNYTTQPFFSVVELSYDGMDVAFETAIVGWQATEELSLTAGNILSYLGWETYDATGLYQYSYAYRSGTFDENDNVVLDYFKPLYPAYAVGAAADYVTDTFSLGVWVGDGSDGDISYEVAGKFYGVEGLTIFAAWADDPGYQTINFWVSYEIGDFIFAAEYVDVDNEGAPDSTGYLFMANWALDSFGLTLRYSTNDNGDFPEDWELATISPSYAFSDNLLGLLEFSYIIDGYEGVDYLLAAELIYTF